MTTSSIESQSSESSTSQTPIWLEKDDVKAKKIRGMFADIAPTYDRINGWMTFKLHRKWRGLAVKQLGLSSGDTVVDICTGTADFIPPLRQAVGDTGTVFGFDFCEAMVRIGQTKQIPGTLALGDALKIPIRNESADAVSVGWGIRNVTDIDGAHAEVFRILKPGGRFISIDTAQPKGALMRKGSKILTKWLLPFVGGLFGKKDAYTYLPESTLRFWSREKLAQSMKNAGFERVAYHDFFFGNICMHRGVKPQKRGIDSKQEINK